MAGGTTVAVAMGEEDIGPETTAYSSGGVWSKLYRKLKNALNFILGSAEEEGSKKNRITEVMEKQELSKAVFTIAFPMTTGLILLKSDTLSPMALHFILVPNVVGITATWNGMLLRNKCPRIANFLEQAGVSSVLLGFYTLVGNYLPPELRFFPVLLGFSVLLPFVISAFPGGRTDEEGVKEEDDCPV